MEEEYRLIQEDYTNDPWKILVCAILVRRCRGSVAKAMARILFKWHPTAEDFMVMHDAEKIFALLQPLGFGRVRTEGIIQLTKAYVELDDPYSLLDIAALPQVGNYALESYTIFILGETNILPEDVVLQRYLRRIGALA
jgi:endonuclease III